jgi:hypothetical protein
MEEWNDGFKKERDKFFAQYSIIPVFQSSAGMDKLSN